MGYAIFNACRKLPASNGKLSDTGKHAGRFEFHFNTLRTGDADLRF